MTAPPDFGALRAARNAAVLKHLTDFATEHGFPVDQLHTTFNPDACYCACVAGGPCEHDWNGPAWESEDGRAWSATCSRCGMTAMSHSMRVGP